MPKQERKNLIDIKLFFFMAAKKHWVKEDKNVNYFHLIQMIARFENSGIIRHTGDIICCRFLKNIQIQHNKTMKNDSFLYFDTINKVFTSKNKLCRTLKILPNFHAKPGFDYISMLQKYKKATDFRLIS